MNYTDIPRISTNVLKHALGLAVIGPDDLVVEFGVFQGRTLRTIATRLPCATVYDCRNGGDRAPQQLTKMVKSTMEHYRNII
jgi:hypothetical protein